LPQAQLAELCFSGACSLAEIKRLVKGAGGLVDLLGTSDLREVERRSGNGRGLRRDGRSVGEGGGGPDPAFEAEPVDRVVLTGGMARSARFAERVSAYLGGMPCGITVYPGENEMVALAKGALRVLDGKEEQREYGEVEEALLR
jgi:butyrate kinase